MLFRSVFAVLLLSLAIAAVCLALRGRHIAAWGWPVRRGRAVGPPARTTIGSAYANGSMAARVTTRPAAAGAEIGDMAARDAVGTRMA